MTDSPLADALDVALYAGEILLRSNAETWRVEDTVSRLLTHFGATESDVVATVTGISLSASDGTQWMTRVRRVRSAGIDLARIDAVNEVSRLTIREDLTPMEVRRELQLIDGWDDSYRMRFQVAAGLLIAGGFTFLFGGGWLEVLATLPGALVLTLVQLLLVRFQLPALAINATASLVGVVVAVLMGRWFGSPRVDVVILSTVVILVPGAAIVSAINDLLGGQLLAGLARGANASLIAAAIAAGVVVGLALTNMTL